MRWCRQRVVWTLLLIPTALYWPSVAAAQDGESGFVGGSFLLWSGLEATEDPGPGFLHTTFQGSLDWPAAGALIHGGGFVTRRWSVGGEFAFRQVRTTTASEGSFTHSESIVGTAHYTNREQLFSVIGRRHGAARVAIEPFAGFTVARTTRSLTNRQNVYYWFGGTIAGAPPDERLTEWSRGLLAGAEIAVRANTGLSFASGARLHWFHGRQESEYADNHIGLRSPEYVLQISAGVIWRPSR